MIVRFPDSAQLTRSTHACGNSIHIFVFVSSVLPRLSLATPRRDYSSRAARIPRCVSVPHLRTQHKSNGLDASNQNLYLPAAFLAYCLSKHCPSGFSPLAMLYGQEAAILSTLGHPSAELDSACDPEQQTLEQSPSRSSCSPVPEINIEEQARYYHSVRQVVELKILGSLWVTFDYNLQEGSQVYQEDELLWPSFCSSPGQASPRLLSPKPSHEAVPVVDLNPLRVTAGPAKGGLQGGS
ncbi:hypothetical protein DSO57_1009465 [Entomophthora muscae]|uniref:Uncharacterized protein n=1 Tax=Entomophthora muscae TaxID=34485 RepID=A0ACC2UHA3_9FUNG|nr:hypothetical protein DSO57_1009465 [Entomophthora muscae]